MSAPPSSARAQIANDIAAIYKAAYGRGPTTVGVQVTDEAVVCILQDVNAAAQQALVRYGAVAVAQATHQELQNGMAPEMTAVVEAATGQAVRTYIPGFNAEAGATTDTFLLDPRGS